LAKENLKADGVNATALRQDIFQTTFREESFDIVYSLGLNEHFQDPAQIIDIQIKLLKNGGTLIATTPNFKGSLSFAFNKIMGR
jgi:2-polyprenyl-3-methyl-5-hydroxy-6-metoxy-1,4-benzoquinol methylase